MPRRRNTTGPIQVRQRRRDAELPEVPTFERSSEQLPRESKTENEQEDAADKAIRRMIEAAYT